MAYILNGSGSFSAYFFGERQEEGCEYHTNDLFLIPPDSPHLFTIKEHSKFAFVRFTQNYLTDYIDCKIGESLSLRSGFHIHLSDNDRSAFCRLMKLIVGENRIKAICQSCCCNIMSTAAFFYAHATCRESCQNMTTLSTTNHNICCNISNGISTNPNY